MSTITCIDRYMDKTTKMYTYELKDDKTGKTKNVKSDMLKHAILSRKIEVSNLKLTSDNRLIFSNKEKKEINPEIFKLEQLEKFEAKQKLTGKIFDFSINRISGEIYITKYYDDTQRKEIRIPVFVDGFIDTYETNDGAFSNCIYIERVIAGKNIKGSLTNLFYRFKGNKLDLTDFDTTNITSMCNMFLDCTAKEILLGGKFNTNNVTNLEGIFMRCLVEELDLKNFNTHKVTNMKYMFNTCEAKTINLGDNFDTSRVFDMSHMFSTVKTKYINLGNKFNTSKVLDMSFMFHKANLASLEFGDKFYTGNVKDMKYMFSMLVLDKLILGSNFNTIKVEDMKLMFFSSKIMKLDLGNNFDTSNVRELRGMFEYSNIPVIDLKDKFIIKDKYKTSDIINGCRTTKIIINQPEGSYTLKRLRSQTCMITIESY